MKKIAKIVGLDVIQLHGDESAAIAKELPCKVIKAFPAEPDHFTQISTFPCDYYLIDSPFGKNRGGNGTIFDWNIMHHLPFHRDKIILAGGLTPDNIQQAIQCVNPAGIDVSSGVETNGEKDMEKIKQFIKYAKDTRKDESIDNIHNA
ncbi:phosphoribosylanthranilate isomerase [Virgibacillus saliphilus]|uniref:phosphoribosylanthranilate isomerase n=1 Tax=Virgibacillus saliphilus TaxID=2831674 RepID=UPI0028167A7C|nr:phosphoribosylanthranilate isomerase [Virgibacillus sp. NKC19-3]